MKKLMKQIIAFVLMVCMLSAVMAPTVLAVTDNEDGSITYTYGGEAGNADIDAGTYDDITVLARYKTTAMKDKKDYLQANNFGRSVWIALSVNVEVAGNYTVKVRSSGTDAGADVYFLANGSADYASKAAELTTASAEYIGSGSTTSNAWVDHAMTKEIPCVAGDNVFLLKGTGTGNYRFEAITLAPVETPVEKVVNGDNGTYNTVADALTAGETNITLTGDITEDINLTDDATLDLNGNTVTGYVNAVYGKVTDSGATKGGVEGEVYLQSSNPAIALRDNDTYRFFEYGLVNVGEKNGKMGTDGAVYFGFGLFFEDAAAYDYVADGGLTICATLSWTGAKAGSAEIGGMTEAVAQWIGAKPTTDNGNCLYIKVTGLEGNLEAGDTVTVTPSFTYADGVNGSFGGAITYTVG